VPRVCLGRTTDKRWYVNFNEQLLKAAVAHMRWSNVKDRSGSRTRIPLVTEKSREDTRFTRPILQIVFPLTQDVEDLPGTFVNGFILI
jgi:hypothetical protein